MGGVALQAVCGIRGILDKRAPKRGYIYDVTIAGHSCLALPTIHPSHIIRGAAKLTGVQIFDLQKAVTLAAEGETPYKPHYVLSPSRIDVDLFRVQAAGAMATSGAWLTCDIETERDLDDESGAITRISFAFEPGHAITIPWKQKFLPAIQALLSLPTEYLVVWNAGFDIPRLRAAGMAIERPVWDAMQAWHFLQSDLPKGLGFVAPFYTNIREWKSKGNLFPEEYSCHDSAITCEIAYAIRDLLIAEVA